ncbi:MAG: hypothetical protein FWG73_03790 [Planctomycetaceae bacterium]|nr:hypothetical protein [Planctomycetaceae bacterium]
MYRIALFIVFSFVASVLGADEPSVQPSEASAEVQPVIEQPDEPPAAQTPTILPFHTANSLARIVDPFVADRLALDETQRNEAIRLINVQTRDVSNAQAAGVPPEQILEIYKQTEERLANLLTATQRAVLEQGLDGTRIRLVFRNQPWRDVLQFIADQGSYHLIMDAPPPGPFNYSDAEERTIVEVLDLINSILISNGYTVIRRDRILQLLDLRRPIPVWVFPVVRPEELVGRGSSEFVSVQYELERRDMATVRQGIAHLISPPENPYARVFELGGNNLRVIDRVEVQNAILRIINSTDNPQPPQRQEEPRPEPPPPPRWETYTIAKNDPEKIEAVFREYVPNIQMLRLPNSREMHVFAPPPDHERLEDILKMLETDTGAGRGADFVFVPYQLTSGTFAAFLVQLEQLGTQDRLQGHIAAQDAQRNLVMVWATAEQHQLLEQIYAQMMGQSQQQAAGAASGDGVVVFSPKNIALDTLQTVIEDIYPAARIVSDSQRGQIVIRVRAEQKEPLELLLQQLDADDPEAQRRFFKSYPITTGFYSIRANWSRYSPVQFIADLQRLAPAARISFDEQSQQLIVWGTEGEHEIIEAAVSDLIGDGSEKRFQRFELRRMNSWTARQILRRMFPTVEISLDDAGRTLIAEGHPRLLPRVKELLDVIDPSEPSEHDPVVIFYALHAEPTQQILAVLRQFAPWPSQIVPDIQGKQIMVLAKPAEHKIIEANVDLIIGSFTPPEEPVLCIYTATREERTRLEAFFQVASAELRGARILPDGTPWPGQQGRGAQQQQGAAPTNRIAIWARPSEHELIATVLQQFQASQAGVPDRQLRSFPMSVGDMTTALNILRVSHPDAMPFPDTSGNRLMVWAIADDMRKVAETLRIQGSIDDREMLAYSVVGVSPETLRTVILEIFQGLRVTPEPQNRKILVWASPEEHVKIAEIVEQANKQVDPDSELAEKFAVYSAANLDIDIILPLFQAIIPEADVHPSNERIVVRAIARDHARIEELLTQLRQRDETLRPKLVVHPFGETDPVMIEALLRSQLPNAESMSPDDLVIRLGWSYYYERDPWSRNYFGIQQTPKTGYYKVDPPTRSVYVFATEEQHELLAEAMKQLIAAGNMPGVQLTIRRYSLNDISSFWNVETLLQRVAPSAIFQPVFELVQLTHPEWGPYWSNRFSGEMLVYTFESEHEKLEQLIQEMNDRTGGGQRQMLTITLPENTPFSRERIMETIQQVHTNISPMPGGMPNQILVWAQPHRLEQIQKIVDEIAQPLPVGERTVPRSYPLQFISTEDAVAWLSALYPNVAFDPSRAGGIAPTQQTPQQRRQQPPAPSAGGTRFIIAVATPLEHIEIAKTIQELDRDMPDSHKMVPRTYSVDDVPPETYWQFYDSLVRAFPNAVATPRQARMAVLVVATENDHREVARFLEAYRTDNERSRPRLEIYILARHNYYFILGLLQRIAPAAFISQGATPQIVIVWATPREQLDIVDALSMLETAAVNMELDYKMAVYKTGTGRANLVIDVIRGQFPGVVAWALNPNEIFVWGAPAVHEGIAPSLEAIAGVFPEPELRPYFFKHVRMEEGFHILNQAFVGQVVSITPRHATDDLLIFATADVHAKIEASIANFDIPRPADTELQTRTFDITDLPSGMFWHAVGQVHNALQGRVHVSQGVTPGQLIAIGKPADLDKVGQMVAEMLRTYIELETRVHDLSEMPDGSIWNVINQITAALQHRVQATTGAVPGQLVVIGRPADQIRVDKIVEQILGQHVVPVVKAYDLSDLPPGAFWTALDQIRESMQWRVQTTPGVTPGQLVVRGRPTDIKRVDEMVEQMLTERPEATASTKVYTLQRASNVQNIMAIIPTITPSARPQIITGSNQIMVLARAADHAKIDDAITALNEAEPDVLVHLHPLKNINLTTATLILNTMRAERGHDIRVFYDGYGYQFVVLGKSEDQQMVAEILDSIRAEDRDLLAVRLDYVDPVDAQSAINTLFIDEPLSVSPSVNVNLNTNMIFVQGMPPQLERVSRLLREMGENVWYPVEPANGQQSGGNMRPAASNIRTINLRGDANILRELQRHWNQPNPLQIVRPEGEGGSETPSQFSLEDEIRRDAPMQTEPQPEGAPPVFVVVNADGSVTITSADTVALDQLESLLQRINSGIVFEGRDYTIYSVRNISSDIVYGRLALVLRDKLMQQMPPSPGVPARPRLDIRPDLTTNTIFVQGSRVDRQEVGRLIAQFDVSELPGTQQVQRPVSVQIENTEATRVLNEVLKVYQQKMWQTFLPGGVRPRIEVNTVSNSLEIIAPEPLLSELKEYIEEVDQKAQDEPGRKLQVIQLGVRAQVIDRAMQELRQAYMQQQQPFYGYGMMPMQGFPMQGMPMQGFPMQQFGGGFAPGMGIPMQRRF